MPVSQQKNQQQMANLVQLVFFLGLLLISSIIYYFLAVRPSGQLPGLFPVSVSPTFFLWLIIGLVFPLLFLYVFLKLLPSMDLIYDPNVRILANMYSLPFMVIYFLANAFVEELLFRGAIQYAFGLFPAVILFTLAHISYYKKPVMLIEVFVLGLFFGLLYTVSQSLWLCTICHGFYNWILMWLIKTDRIAYYPASNAVIR
ncbi:MAG: CPBP family intramembrane metalloprotease [Peptococcaceae bacterium]|nr:CPBP family intramembrane metalloprotease [Peptococcaceae bacterium]